MLIFRNTKSSGHTSSSLVVGGIQACWLWHPHMRLCWDFIHADASEQHGFILRGWAQELGSCSFPGIEWRLPQAHKGGCGRVLETGKQKAYPTHCWLMELAWVRGKNCNICGPLVLYHGEGNGNPLQYSCLGNPMDRGAWRVAVHGVAKNTHTHTHTHTHPRTHPYLC